MSDLDLFCKLNHKQVKPALQQAIKAKYNVMLQGRHGCGKTALVKEVFTEELGADNWAYFSGSTMDPFLDFMGCPTIAETDEETKDKKRVEKFLEMIRPKRFTSGKIRGIFIDEFNRAPKAVRNACMELLQFNTMNGERFDNLEFIWTAINPPNDDYDVEVIDPAQIDRFEMRIAVDETPSFAYFNAKYPNKAASAIEWWKSLKPEFKQAIPPRRLDYALDAIINQGINPSYILPHGCGSKGLQRAINAPPAVEQLRGLHGKPEKIKEFLADEKQYNSVKSFIMERKNMIDYFFHAPKTKIGEALAHEKNIRTILAVLRQDMRDNKDKHRQNLNPISAIVDIYEVQSNKKLIEIIDNEEEDITLDMLRQWVAIL